MGTTVRWGLKEAWSKDTGQRTRTGFEAYGVGPSQRDGREVIAKRKGEITLAARRGLKEARSKDASRCTRTGSEAYGGGRAGKGSRSPYPSSSLVVNPAVARRRR